MTAHDPFSRPTLDSNAVDLAWVRYNARQLSRFDAALTMTLAGTTWPEAVALPSTARMLAGVSS